MQLVQLLLHLLHLHWRASVAEDAVGDHGPGWQVQGDLPFFLLLLLKLLFFILFLLLLFLFFSIIIRLTELHKDALHDHKEDDAGEDAHAEVLLRVDHRLQSTT